MENASLTPLDKTPTAFELSPHLKINILLALTPPFIDFEKNRYPPSSLVSREGGGRNYELNISLCRAICPKRLKL